MNGQPSQFSPSHQTRYLRIVVLVLVGLTVYFIYRYSLSRSIQTRIDAIHRAGFPATCAELDKWYVQPPPGQNAADIYSNAFAHFEMWTNKDEIVQMYIAPTPEPFPHRPHHPSGYYKYTLLPVVGQAKLPSRTEPLPPDMQKLIADYLSNNFESLQLLDQAAAMKACRFPVNLDKGIMTLLPHLNKIRHATQLLELKAIHEAEEKQSASAVSAVITLLGVARSLDREPCVTSCMVEASVKNSAMESLERVLNRVSLSNSELVSLAVAIQESSSRESVTRALAGDRAMCISWLTDNPPGVETVLAESMAGQLGSKAFLHLARLTGLFQEDEKVYLDVLQRYISAAQLRPPDSITVSLATDTQVENISGWHLFLDLILVGRADVVLTGEAANMKMTAAQVALAIECYRVANGQLPGQLSELVPGFLPSVPVDSFDGKPLRYKPLPNGYVVYSVGKDRKDDGGMPKKSPFGTYDPDITFTVER